MPDQPWLDLGRQWAALDRPVAHQRLADALNRWRQLGPIGRGALIALVLERRPPPDPVIVQLVKARFVNEDEVGGLVVPVYAGAAVVALDELRRGLARTQSDALLEWYRRDQPRVSRVYVQGHRNSPYGLHLVFGALARLGLIQQADRRICVTTPLGWGVAWMADDAAILALAGRRAS